MKKDNLTDVVEDMARKNGLEAPPQDKPAEKKPLQQVINSDGDTITLVHK